MVSGLVAAVVGLGVAELVASSRRSWRSPVLDVGDRVIDRVPRWAKDFAIDQFGTNDKVALLVGIGALLALYAGVVGLVAFRRSLSLGLTGIALFGALGCWAATQARSRPPLDVAIPSVAGAVTAGVVLALAVRSSQLPAPASDPVEARAETGAGSNRRQFLALAAGAAAGTAVFALGRRFAARFDAAAARAAVILPRPLRPLPPVEPSAQVPEVVPFFTPNEDFYRIDINLSVPQIDHERWSLRVWGLVERELVLSYDDLLQRDLVEADITLTCVSNEVGGNLLGTARWLGLPLATLLDEAGVSPTADQVIGRSFDGYTCGFPLEALDGREALVAVGMNGEPLPLAHGFPARLIVPGLYGYTSATKWLTEIELGRFDELDQYWVQRGWVPRAPIKMSSRIDTPRGLATVRQGVVGVGGVAWAQPDGVAGVQLQVDGGDWVDATLAPGAGGSAWRQWTYPWNARSGRHSLTVRAIDANGAIQVGERSEPFPSGSTGWHQIVVLVD